MNNVWRKTSQDLAPARPEPTTPGHYGLYPGFPVDSGLVKLGFASLAEHIAAQIGQSRRVIVDGYGGVLWPELRQSLNGALEQLGIHAAWFDVSVALRNQAEINTLVAPFLGGDDPLFGTRFTGILRDFFDTDQLRVLRESMKSAEVSIVYGCGAALVGVDGLLIYVDVPKNEIQFRARAGSIHNLGADQAAEPKVMYKRFYFVDWVALNKHKVEQLPRVGVIIDGQRPDEPTWMNGADFRDGLEQVSRNFFRVRPWFEPGPWGGQWIKQHIPELPQNTPNYAWSFELITPENGLAFESNGILLEVSFDCLMYHNNAAILGSSASRFGYEFPIRFDFLDTFDGGNLSVQCHPRLDYARHHFGETITQDETYYILDCAPDAQVYLGFRDDIDPTAFRKALETSYQQGTPFDVAKFVNIEPAQRHDLFLIPNGTIHCSGKNSLVLEISATPYIFTFKMYDWLRLDLEGKPRPLNIERAFENLYFERKGERVHSELVSQPYVLGAGDGWQIVHLPTHPDHFYDVHRFDFTNRIEAETGDSCHVMSLVEGQSVMLETAGGMRQRFNYAETFVIPAAAGRYRLINEGTQPVKVIKCFLKRP